MNLQSATLLYLTLSRALILAVAVLSLVLGYKLFAILNDTSNDTSVDAEAKGLRLHRRTRPPEPILPYLEQ